MRARLLTRPACVALLCTLSAACGNSSTADSPTATARATATAGATAQTSGGHLSASRLLDWPEFGLDPQRSDVTESATGITSANVSRLRRTTVRLPGTVDSSPIYIHGASVDGATHDVVVVTTTYGKTIAIDAGSGQILWTFTPPGYGRYAGSAQFTTATPLADPDRLFIYAVSPDGLIHKLALASGREIRSGSWPVSVTRDPTHEKIAPALNIVGPYLIVVTGGYYGDIPPYQGHVVAIERASGHIHAIFNALCANRRYLMVPSSCSASDSAIWSRAGAVLEPGGKRIVLVTGNGPWNGRTNFGDSAIEITLPSLRLRQAFTPANQQQLNASDTDLGSGGPALLSSRLLLIGGKDGVLRVLDLAHMDGRAPSAHEVLGGEAQRLSLPGGGQLLSEPAVWHHAGKTTVFVGGENGTSAFALRAGRLQLLWENRDAGTSPVLAGGLLYVYDPGGGINVYETGSARPLAKLPGAPGHWNSPIVVDGHVIEPEGNANQRALGGTIDLFAAPGA